MQTSMLGKYTKNCTIYCLVCALIKKITNIQNNSLKKYFKISEKKLNNFFFTSSPVFIVVPK